MGMEKVIPSMTDLVVFLAILARSATGQKLSSYTTLVRGPRRAGELEGPEEFHLILLDNGRSRQIAATLREALYCLRCGACLNVCPVYRQIGGHAYGYTYPGPIGILLTAMLKGNESVRELAHASSLCGACKDVCPVRIDIPRMLVELREQLDREKIAPWTERVVFKAFRRLLLSPTAFRLSATVGRLRAAAVHPAGPAARAAAGLRQVDEDPRSPAGGGPDLPGAVEGAAVTARAEFLERIRREISKTPGLFGASTAPRPADPAAAAETVRRELAERWPEALERFRAEFERVAGVFHRVPDLAAVPAAIGAIARGCRREEPGHAGIRSRSASTPRPR